MSGIRITVEDITTGDSESVEVEDDYVIVADGRCHYSVQAYPNGTHVITVKRPSGASDQPIGDADEA